MDALLAARSQEKLTPTAAEHVKLFAEAKKASDTRMALHQKARLKAEAAAAGAVNIMDKKCEGCGLKVPSFGLPSEGKRRWCAGCAKAHAGAEHLKHTAGSRRTQAGGSPQKKPKVTDGWTLHFHFRS